MSTIPGRIRRSAVRVPATPGAVKIISDRFALVVTPEAQTLNGFRQWATKDDFPERVRVTFLDGEVIIDMSNEEINAHVGVKTEMGRVLAAMVREEKLGKYFGDGVLLTNVAADVSNNPDALFLSRDTLQVGRARLVPRRATEHLYREVEGVPDWVLEVVSEGSVQKDTVRLRDAYHRAGIPEYWIADARGEEIVFQILLRRKHDYILAPSKDGWQRSKVFGRSFRLEREMDEFGLWEFTLHVRAE